MSTPSVLEVRLAELVASLSLATDLGLGLPQEHVLRQTVLASRLGACAGMSEDELAAVYYVSLLAWVGCVSDSHELAHWFDDDRRMRADSYLVDKVRLPMMRLALEHVAAGSGPIRRMSTVGRFLQGGFRETMATYVTHCQTTGDIADRLGLDKHVGKALSQAFARWDGKGYPRTRGPEIELAMRVVQIADDSEVFHRTGGIDAATAMLHALEVFADYADLKSPWHLGHSRALAALVVSAAEEFGLSAEETVVVERAALTHRLGAIGVSTGIWNKATLLSFAEIEHVRTVPYLTERILHRQPRLARIGAVAGMAQERMDGSGFPRALRGVTILASARLLAVADVYQTWSEDRPGRAALSAAAREDGLHAEVGAGRLDAAAVRAVLSASEHVVRRRATLVAGLTAREVQVLALLVRGRSNKQIA